LSDLKPVGASIKALKTSLYFKSKNATIKNFKLEIIFKKIHPSSNTKPPHPKHPIMLEALGGGLQMFLEHQKQRNNV
jgi:hypothetical protein